MGGGVGVGDLDRILARAGSCPNFTGTTTATGTPGAPFADPDAFDAVKPRHDDVGLEDLRWMLDQLPANYCDDRDSWRDAIFAVHHQFHDTEAEDDALEILIAWSQRSTNYTEGCVSRSGGRRQSSGRRPRPVHHRHAEGLAGRCVEGSAGADQGRGGVAASADWKARIEAADEAALRGVLASEIRAGQIDSLTRAAIDKLYQQRLRTLWCGHSYQRGEADAGARSPCSRVGRSSAG
jgi:hypothetical protein